MTGDSPAGWAFNSPQWVTSDAGLSPLRDRIVVLPDPERDNITSAGITVKSREGFHTTTKGGGLNESAMQLGRQGTVIEIGPDIDRDQLAPGDRIMFGEFEYPEHYHNGQRFLVMQDKDVCGVREAKLRPLHDRVIVKRLEQETKTASGIVIPDNAAEKPDQGEVLAVGPGKRSDKGDFIVPKIKTGDRVLFGKYSGQTIRVDGDEMLVMREEDLSAVVEDVCGVIES